MHPLVEGGRLKGRVQGFGVHPFHSRIFRLGVLGQLFHLGLFGIAEGNPFVV